LNTQTIFTMFPTPLMAIGEINKLSNFELASKVHIYRYDNSVGRGDFKTAIDVGKVIQGTITDFKV
jgi:hypothetical protein